MFESIRTRNWALGTAFILATLPSLGCTVQNSGNPGNQEGVTAQLNEAEVERLATEIAESATHIADQKIYLFELKLSKSNFSLDPFKHIGNEMKAQYRTVIVGEEEYNKRSIGDQLSSKGDVGGFIFGGEIASYKVKVHKKEVDHVYSYTDKDGKSHEISSAVYNRALGKLKAGERNLHHEKYAGLDATTILDDTIENIGISKQEELERYYVEVEIKNSTFTLNPIKHLRNSANTHRLTLEVPRELYDSKDNAFDSKTSSSFWFNGRLSSLSGKITKRWSVVDKEHTKLTLKDGTELVKTNSEVE